MRGSRPTHVRTFVPVVLLLAACVPVFEDTEPAEVETPAEPTFEEKKTPSAIPEIVEQATSRARVRRCAEGKVEGPGGCERCTEDAQCGTSCNLETARCAPEGWCEADEQCGDYETCDEGLCINRAEPSGHCGLGPIYFAWDSATLTARHKARIASAVKCLSKSATLYVEGHGDALGSEEFNILLTEQRGTAVRNALVEAGLPREQVMVIAKGSLEADGTDPKGRAADRRVLVLSPDLPTGSAIQ